MTKLLSPNAKQQFFTDGSTVAAGYLLYTYAANTTNPEATYSNRAGTVANANPIILDARGEATIYLTPGVMYDYVLKTPLGATIWTREDVSADAGDAAGVSFTPTGTGATGRTLAAYLSDRQNVKARGAVGNGISVTSAVTIASGGTALTAAGAAFTAADVGKAIAVRGAGVAGAPLFALISAHTSATQVTVSVAASTALVASSQRVTYGTDDAAAFQLAIDALAADGGVIDVPDGIYMIHASTPSSGTKSIQWNIGSGCVFDGALGGSTSLSAFPRANTNESIVPFGVFNQVRSSTPLPGVNTLASAAGVFEALQPTAFGGSSVGLYAGARSASATGYLWAANMLAQADAGFGQTLHGIELDINIFTLDAAALVKGLGISGIGTSLGSGGRKADVAIEIQHGVGWKRGIDILDSDIGVQIRTTCTTGLSLYAPAGSAAAINAKQRANGADGIVVERFTDVGATGTFMEFQTAAGANLFQWNVDGTSSQTGIHTAGGFATTGTTDTFNLALRFAAPVVGAGNVGLGNGTANTVGAAGGAAALPATPLGYWIANVGGTTVKIPYYNN